MTTQNEKSPAPELASEAMNQRPGKEADQTEVVPTAEGILGARAAGGNGTSSKVCADALTAQAALAAIETFEIVGENNDSREPNDEDRFILTEFIAHAFGGYPVEQHEAAPAAAQAPWKTGTPPTKNGKHREYIVAVRRAHDKRRVFVFSASHANNYDDELRDQDGNEFIANGWYDIGEDPSGEFNTMFTPTLCDGDEVLGWQELPKWSDPAAQPDPQVADDREAMVRAREAVFDWQGEHELTLTVGAINDLARLLVSTRASSPNAAGAQIGWAWISPTGHVSRFTVEFDGKHDQLVAGWQVRPVAFCDGANAAGAEDLDGLAHELWAAAQIQPRQLEGIEDGVRRIKDILSRAPAQATEPVTIYQIRTEESAWLDVPQDVYERTKSDPALTRAVYAALPTPASAPAELTDEHRRLIERAEERLRGRGPEDAEAANGLLEVLTDHSGQPEPRCRSVAACDDEAREFLYGNLETIESAIALADATGNCSQARGLEAVEYQIRRLLSRKPEPRADVMGWQPIETAPRNGTEVVLLFDDEVEVLGKIRPRVRAASWLVDWTIPYRRDNPPTHWMPLPVAPTDDARAEAPR